MKMDVYDIMYGLNDVSDYLVIETAEKNPQIKEQSIVKWSVVAACVCLVIAAALYSAFMKGSGYITPSDTVSEDTTDAAETLSPEDEAKMKAFKMFVPTSEGAFILDDDVVYSNSDISDNFIIINGGRPDGIRGVHWSYLFDYNKGTDPVIACYDENCTHDNVTCPALTAGVWLIVSPEGSDDVVAYYERTFSPADIKVDGYRVSLSRELGTGKDVDMLFEYNLTTGVRRAVTKDFPKSAYPRWYYNGKIYTNYRIIEHDSEHYMDTGEFIATYYFPVACVDVKTGEITYLEDEGEQMSLFFIGIYDGLVYGIDMDGMLVTCSLDLSEHTNVRMIDDDFKFYNHVFGDHYTIVDNTLYILLNDSEEEFSESFTFYKLDLSDENSKLEKIADGIHTVNSYGDYVYFTPYDLYTKNGVNLVNKGTLYRYNTKTGATDTLLDDDSYEIGLLKFIDDDRIIFQGICSQNESSYSLCDYEYVFATGEVRIIYNRGTDGQ